MCQPKIETACRLLLSDKFPGFDLPAPQTSLSASVSPGLIQTVGKGKMKECRVRPLLELRSLEGV